jgi:hypothetical protein
MCPVPTVLPTKSCPYLSCGRCSIFIVLAVLPFPYGPDRPVQAGLMGRFVQTNLYRLSCSKISYPRRAVPTVLSWLSCHARPTRLSCPSCPVLAAIFWPSGPFLSVLAVISRLSFLSVCHVPLPVPAVLSQLSCLSCPAKKNRIPALLSPLYWPCCHILAFSVVSNLSSLTCPDRPVQANLSSLTCPAWPVRPNCPGPDLSKLYYPSRHVSDGCPATVVPF